MPFWQALQTADRLMRQKGYGPLSVTDGFRSYAAQVDVKRRKPNLAATPGRSVHGIGYAADLKLSSAQQRWLEKNGAKYGLYRPISYEPWHWQYKPPKGDGGYVTPNDYGRKPGDRGQAPHGMQPELWRAWSSANREMVANGFPPLDVESAYRSPSEQRQLRKQQPELATTVDKSAHTVGMAVDARPDSDLQLEFFRRLAPRHGLMPTDEPWHFNLDPR
jgi:LAS superfamily LD-carboxypeptidase LdcB